MILTITLALAAVALTAIARAVAPFSLQLRKPFSCDLCMSFWCGWMVVGAQAQFDGAGLELHTLAPWILHQALPTIGLTYAVTVVLAWLRDTRVTNAPFVEAPQPPVSHSTSQEK